MEEYIVYLFLATAASCFLQGVTGFGSALILAPVASLFFDPSTNIIFLMTISVVLNLWSSVSIRASLDFKFLVRILLFSFIGVFVGINLLQRLDPNYIKVFVYVSSIIFSIILMFTGEKIKSNNKFESVVGFVTGFLQSTTGISGPPLVLFLNSMHLSHPQIKRNIALILLFTSTLGLTILNYHNTLTLDKLYLGLMAIPVVVVFSWLGNKASEYINHDLIRILSLIIIIILSVVGLAKIF